MGGGLVWQVLSGQITYFNISPAKKIYLHEYQNQNICFQTQQSIKCKKKKIEKSKKTKHKKKTKTGVGENEGWEEGKAALSKVGKHEDMKTHFKI